MRCIRCHCASLAFAITLLPGVSLAETIPSGTILELRLRQEVNSYSSAQGSTIQAYLSAPVVVADFGFSTPSFSSILVAAVRTAKSGCCRACRNSGTTACEASLRSHS